MNFTSEKSTVPCAPQAQKWILAATILGSSMAFIDGTVVNVALPALQSSLHADVIDVQWVIEAYGLFLAALILVGGSLGDLFGRRRMFVSGTIVFAIASAFCGLALNIQQLILARSLQGVGAAFLVPGSLAIIGSCFDEKSRGRAIGVWSAFTAITTALGPVLGGWLVEHASWRAVFFINLPLAAAVVVIAFCHIPESRSGATYRIDWLGAVAATLGLAGITFAFIDSVNRGWTHPLVIGSMLGGVASLAAFFMIESSTGSPMVPLNLFRSSTFTGANVLTLLLYAAVGVFFFLFPLNLIQVQGYSATAAGAATLPMVGLLFLLSRWSGGLVARIGARMPLIVGPLVVSAGFGLLSWPKIGGSYWTTFFPGMLVLGFGMSVTVAPLTTTVMNAVPDARMGTASGINNAISRIAGVLAIAVLGMVMIQSFRSALKPNLAKMSLPAETLREIQKEEIKLGAMRVPAGLDDQTHRAVQIAIGNAFVKAFRLVLLICAGLALASSAATWRMISAQPKA